MTDTGVPQEKRPSQLEPSIDPGSIFVLDRLVPEDHKVQHEPRQWIPNFIPRVSRLPFIIGAFNLAVVLGVVLGILALDNRRDRLIDIRIEALAAEADLIAAAIGRGAVLGLEDTALDPDEATNILRHLSLSIGGRARLYSETGRLIADTQLLSSHEDVVIHELPPLGESGDDRAIGDRFYNFISRIFYHQELPPYREYAGQPGTDFPEVREALEGRPARARRQDSQGDLVFTVTYPVQKFKVILGALLISSQGSEIDRIVREDRVKTLLVLMIGLVGSIFLSGGLFLYIAGPVRRLATSADSATMGTNFARVEIPDLSARRDEIGDLSVSLRTMIRALYNRMEAIESFAADVSHEIKNPLTSMRSAVETLEIAKTDEARQKLLDLIQQDIGRLDRLITDISDASRVDAELARETSEPVDLTALMHSLADIYATTQKEGQPRVLFSSEPSEKGYLISGIEDRLGQVIRNLVANAQSFTAKDGQIDVRMRRISKRLGDYVVITVDDEGPGIPEDNLETIFNRFYTERPGIDEFGKNSGLGLSISRQIIEAHDGRLWAENRADRLGNHNTGARFTIELPVGK